MTSLILGIYQAPEKVRDQSAFREMTLAWSRYGYQGDIVEADSIDSLLRQCAGLGHSHCLVQRAGHVIYEQWYPARWGKANLLQTVHKAIEEDDFLVMGQWQQSAYGCPGLGPDCFLIDLKRFEALGQPVFGAPTPEVHTVDTGHTAHNQLKAGGVTKTLSPDTFGWNIVQASFLNDLAIKGFPDSVNEERFDLTNGDTDAFLPLIRQAPPSNIEAFSYPHGDFLKRVHSQTQNARKGAFLFNVESYQDLAEPTGPVDAVFSVAAGFKAYRVLAVNGYTKQSELVFFDYSQRALEIRQFLVENWDGRDFPAFVSQIFERFPEPDTFYQLWAHTDTSNLDWEDVNWFWEKELAAWGGEEEFALFWREFKTLKHHYLHLNLLEESERLFEVLNRYEAPYLWWSNAFFTVFSNWFMTNTERKNLYENWIRSLAQACPHCQVNGSDFNNSSVNGFTAAEYWQAYEACPPTDLQPARLHKTEIRY